MNIMRMNKVDLISFILLSYIVVLIDSIKVCLLFINVETIKGLEGDVER
tara:strand:+ start:361 stop:507 length:147 start_codon:yes stop_codon:yes gene_type:complete